MEVEGCGDKLQTEHVSAGKPNWGTQGDFLCTQPLPCVKIKLMQVNSSIISLDNKEVSRLVINPTCWSSKQQDWHKMTPIKGCTDDIRIQMSLKMEKPSNLKFCGYLHILGRNTFRKWRRRYICLIQVSQYTFVMASYREKKPDPIEIMQLDGYTVDYCDPIIELQQQTTPISGSNPPNLHFFNMVREGDAVNLASEDESERVSWVQAIYRATGQSHKPQLADTLTMGNQRGSGTAGRDGSGNSATDGVNSASGHSGVSNGGGTFSSIKLTGEAERIRKMGMERLTATEPWLLEHSALFKILQSAVLEWRLKDQFVSFGWLSPSQMFILDEYCARYGVRGCYRHLCYLSDLLDRAEHGIMIDPALIHYSFAFCSSHVCRYAHEHDSSLHNSSATAGGAGGASVISSDATLSASTAASSSGVHSSAASSAAGGVASNTAAAANTSSNLSIAHTVLLEEWEKFCEIKHRLLTILERQITEFRYYFPFGRPEGALKQTLGLLERVLMKDSGTPASSEEVREVIKSCLDKAAFVNYTRISEYAFVEGTKIR